MKLSTLLKWVTGACEAMLAIPLAGGLFIMSSGWIALVFMFILHLITLVVSIKNSRFSIGSILGLVTSFIAAIPFVGWFMHTVTAIVLLVDAGISTKSNKNWRELS